MGFFWFKALPGNVNEDLRTQSCCYSILFYSSLFFSACQGVSNYACSIPSLVALLKAEQSQSQKKKIMFFPQLAAKQCLVLLSLRPPFLVVHFVLGSRALQYRSRSPSLHETCIGWHKTPGLLWPEPEPPGRPATPGPDQGPHQLMEKRVKNVNKFVILKLSVYQLRMSI